MGTKLQRTKSKCPLCKIKRPQKVYDSFFMVECKKRHTPMLILNEHRDHITNDEAMELKHIFENDFKDSFKMVDFETRVKPVEIGAELLHWHVYLIPLVEATNFYDETYEFGGYVE
jgi:hypothetical protein